MKRERKLNQDKNHAIAQAAVREFERAGYNSANMDTVAKEANVSKATVYKHFGSKRELFIAIMVQFIDLLNAHHTIKYDPNGSIEAQLTEFGNQKMSVLNNSEYMAIMRVALNVLMNECEVTNELKAMLSDKTFENLIAWFQAAKEDGKLQFDNAEFVANAFIGSIKVHAFFPQIIFKAPPLNKTMQQSMIKNAVASILCQYQKQHKE